MHQPQVFLTWHFFVSFVKWITLAKKSQSQMLWSLGLHLFCYILLLTFPVFNCRQRGGFPFDVTWGPGDSSSALLCDTDPRVFRDPPGFSLLGNPWPIPALLLYVPKILNRTCLLARGRLWCGVSIPSLLCLSVLTTALVKSCFCVVSEASL